MVRRKKRQKKQRLHANDFELICTFKNVKMVVDVIDNAYTKAQLKEIKRIVDVLSKEIIIDKSYVDFKENKHQDTFIELEGWTNLKQLLADTDFGNTANAIQNEEMDVAFRLIICAYIYTILEKYDYDIEHIVLDFKNDSGFMTYFTEDCIEEWKSYPGPWQNWKN